ncbi:MAG: bifunctional oligoribonuclease/PAP phosphatase NrnA [Candidatus Woesebacteria bacterium]|nr:bifunctional oligoribonuclease/PAP phosphatase NrnA [Candidatus Woesebacteria bacterium]
MNYKESTKILKEIKKAKKILVNCHRGPDSDSVGSALALSGVLKKFGKDVTIICPSDIPADLAFLNGADSIWRVNFSTFDFSGYDLFLVIDSSTYSMVTGLKDSDKPGMDTIVIDHHVSNEKFGKINLIDAKTTSTGEMLFKIFEDWGIAIDQEIAECLLTGIIGDTGSFQYQNVGQGTLRIAASLMDAGADKDKIIYNIYRNIDFKEVKMWGKFIENMKIEDNFIWSAISLSTYKDFGEYPYAKEDVANLFFPIVKGTDFGIVMVETNDQVLSVSFRSRSGFDVSKIAEEVGGGGHKAAAGARIEGLPFDQAVNKVLSAARNYAEKS